MKKLQILGSIAAISVIGGLTLLHSETATSNRTPQFDNEDVKVWKTVVLPNQPLQMHRHEHPRVIIPLVGGTMKIVEQTGPGETHDWQFGHAYWLPANAPGTMHADVNVGSKPIVVMVVELEKEK